VTTAPHVDHRTRRKAAGIAGGLFERHGRMVYGVCRAMLRDVHEAEDATQQVFLSAYEALIGGVDVRESGAWLATIARNECRGRIAAGMRDPLPMTDEDLEGLPTGSDEQARRAQVDELRAALAALPNRQREAVILRYLYGLRYGEVAIALGLSRPATEALLFRARRAMRERLRPVVGTALVVPSVVRDELALALPGFGAGASEGAVATGLTGSLLLKVLAGPLGLKASAAVVALSTVGVVGAIPQERAGHATTERAVADGRGENEADVSSRPARQVENDVERELTHGPSSDVSRTSDNDGAGNRAAGGHDGGTSGNEGSKDAAPGSPTSSGPGSPEAIGPTPETAPAPAPTDDPPKTDDGGSSGPSGSSGPGSGSPGSGSETVVATESSDGGVSGSAKSGSAASGSGSDSSGSGSDSDGHSGGSSTSGSSGDSGSGSGSGSGSSGAASGH